MEHHHRENVAVHARAHTSIAFAEQLNDSPEFQKFPLHPICVSNNSTRNWKMISFISKSNEIEFAIEIILLQILDTIMTLKHTHFK